MQNSYHPFVNITLVFNLTGETKRELMMDSRFAFIRSITGSSETKMVRNIKKILNYLLHW